MLRRLRGLTIVAVAAALVTVAGCSSTPPANNNTPTGPKEPDKVTYMTAFGAVGRDAFAWVAQEKGYFSEANLDVTIQLGSAVDSNLTALAAGQAQFAALDFTGATIQAGNGKFKDFRAIAAIHQQTLVSIVSLEGGNVSTPRDLENKKIGAASGSVNQLLFPAYAHLAGIDEKKVTWVNVAPPQLPALLASSQVDALSTFLIGKAGIEKAAGGKKAVIMPYSDFLSDLFGNALVTTADLAKNNPDMVKRFRDAMLKALKYTIENPDDAAAILNKANPTSDVAAAKGEITLMAPYVKPGGNAPIGALDQQRVAKAIAILQGAGLMPAGLAPDAVVAFDLTPKAA
jgi:NitT/TauT family transport system substrate-binding protein